MGMSTDCIIGAVLVFFGLLLKLYPPEHRNDNLGYKTPFAMKSKDTWYEGNRFFGLMLLISGIIFTPFSIFIDYLYGNNSSLSMKISSSALVIIILISFIYTEIHLRKLFDKNGVRK